MKKTLENENMLISIIKLNINALKEMKTKLKIKLKISHSLLISFFTLTILNIIFPISFIFLSFSLFITIASIYNIRSSIFIIKNIDKNFTFIKNNKIKEEITKTRDKTMPKTTNNTFSLKLENNNVDKEKGISLTYKKR